MTPGGGLGSLLRGWASAPYLSLRDTMFRLSVVSLALALWAACTTRWLLLVCSVPALTLFVAVGLWSQHRAEVTGRVEEERQEWEDVQARRAAWPTWKRRLFYIAAFTLFFAGLAWDIWTDFR